MHRRLFSLSFLLLGAVALVPSLAAAEPLSRVSTGQIARFYVDAGGSVSSRSGATVAASAVIYDNPDPTNTFVSVPQQSQEWAEDIHGIGSGPCVGFGAGFVGNAPDSFDVTMTLYDWTGDAAGPGAPLIGPFTFRVPFNTIGIGVGFGPSTVVGPDLWLGVAFSDPSVGLWLHDPPAIGASHDLYWNFNTGMAENFAAGPVANFVATVSVDMPVPVESTTWSRIKSQFQD